MTSISAARVERVLDRWRDDEELFIRECLCVRHKHGGKVIRWDFDSFPAQLKLVRMVRETRRANLPVRIIGLKPRQIGLSTIATALVYHRSSLFRNVLSQIISNDLESAQTINDKNDIFFSYTHPSMRTMRSRSNKREMIFLNPNRKARETNRGLDSRIFVESAKKITVGRSQTVQNLLGSEVGYWKEGQDRALSVMNSIPEVPGTMVIMESTAQGINFFYDLWEMTKLPGSVWQPFFFAWWEHPEYVHPCDENWNADNLSDYEIQIKLKYKLSDEQIAWRRYTIAMKCNGSAELFMQEYPSCAEEAFLTSGRPGFDRIRVMAMQKRHEVEGVHIDLYRPPGASIEQVAVRADESSPIEMWAPPEAGKIYIAGVDVSQGLESGDASCVEVLEVLSRRQVCELHIRCAPDELVVWATLIGWYYNEALLAIESNKDGVYVNAHTSQIYPNIYCREKFNTVDRKVMNEYGWYTDEPMKRSICHELNNQVKFNRCVIHSSALFAEMLQFERAEDGKFGAPPGKHDDLVMGMAIAMWLAIDQHIQYAQAEMLGFGDPRVRVPLDQRIASRHAERMRDLPAELL